MNLFEEQIRLEQAARAITAAYRRALLDPSARIPTYLHAACEAVSASDRDAATAEQRDEHALASDPRSFK